MFPYLQPHCVLQDLATAQVTWVCGVGFCSGVRVCERKWIGGWGWGSAPGLQYQWLPPYISFQEAPTADDKSLTSAVNFSLGNSSWRLKVLQYEDGKQLGSCCSPRSGKHNCGKATRAGWHESIQYCVKKTLSSLFPVTKEVLFTSITVQLCAYDWWLLIRQNNNVPVLYIHKDSMYRNVK